MKRELPLRLSRVAFLIGFNCGNKGYRRNRKVTRATITAAVGIRSANTVKACIAELPGFFD
jgi:uncharacterized Fe-S cluster-containing protein